MHRLHIFASLQQKPQHSRNATLVPMNMTLYHTYEEIEHWLSENGYFEDGYILQVESNPVSITVGYTTKGDYRAHSEHHILPFKIVPSGIIEISPLTLLEPSEIYCIEAIEPLEASQGVGIRIIISPYFDIVANAFTITQEELIKTTRKPWINPDKICAQFPFDAIPTPAFWKEKFREYGFDIAFRYYGGTIKQPEEVPCPNYMGYFIQAADMINETIQGMLISHITSRNGIVSLSFEKRDEEIEDKNNQARSNALWEVLVKILFSLPKVMITSGNCEFRGEELQDFLLGKSRPPVL